MKKILFSYGCIVYFEEVSIVYRDSSENQFGNSINDLIELPF